MSSWQLQPFWTQWMVTYFCLLNEAPSFPICLWLSLLHLEQLKFFPSISAIYFDRWTTLFEASPFDVQLLSSKTGRRSSRKPPGALLSHQSSSKENCRLLKTPGCGIKTSCPWAGSIPRFPSGFSRRVEQCPHNRNWNITSRFPVDLVRSENPCHVHKAVPTKVRWDEWGSSRICVSGSQKRQRRPGTCWKGMELRCVGVLCHWMVRCARCFFAPFEG